MNRQEMFPTLVAMLVDADRTEESYHDLALRICNLFEAPDENAVFWNRKWRDARMEIGSLKMESTIASLELELAARDKDVIEIKEDRDRTKLALEAMTAQRDDLKAKAKQREVGEGEKRWIVYYDERNKISVTLENLYEKD